MTSWTKVGKELTINISVEDYAIVYEALLCNAARLREEATYAPGTAYCTGRKQELELQDAVVAKLPGCSVIFDSEEGE